MKNQQLQMFVDATVNQIKRLKAENKVLRHILFPRKKNGDISDKEKLFREKLIDELRL